LDEKRAWQSGTLKLLFFHLFLDSVISFANSCKDFELVRFQEAAFVVPELSEISEYL
jgi:hypothetical protein